MSEKLQQVKFGKDGQLYVGDTDPSASAIKWKDDNEYLQHLKFSMVCADYFSNTFDLEFLFTLPITQAEFHNLSSEIQNRYVSIAKSYQQYFEEKGDEIIDDRDGKGDILEKRFDDIMGSTQIKKKDFNDFKSQLMQGIKKNTDVDDMKAELRNAHNLIKEGKKIKKKEIDDIRKHYSAKDDAIQIWSKNPSESEMISVIDACRFKNGVCNNTSVGKYFGIDGETAKSWIEKLHLSEYAYNPQKLK